MARYYVDTSIWRDLLEDRRDSIKPLSEFAFKLMEKVLKEKHTIIFSKEIESELCKRFKVEQIQDLALDRFTKENLVLYVKANVLQLKEAETLSARLNIPFLDALHAILARDNSAILVTRDKHFEELRHIVEIRTPEEIISQT
ncbi:MAG: PIN domain-containing protein [Candidatus Diapherotrites archaeon]|nr:PIN domain-containing protein [Candidatus Diapherotrites archaeon]